MIWTHGKLVAIVAAFVCLAPASADAQTKLRYKFKKGEKLNYLQVQNVNMKLNAPGQMFNNSVKQENNLVWTVEDVDANGTATIKQSFARMQFSMEMPNGQMLFDSKAGKMPEGPVGKFYGPILKDLSELEITFKMTPTGKITDVTVPQKFLDAVKKLPGASGLGDMFSKAGLEKMVSQSGVQFKEEPVKKGDSWESAEQLVKMPFGQMKIKSVYVYQGPTKKDSLELESITVEPMVSFVPSPNAQINFNLKPGASSGTILFDNAAGRLREFNLTQNSQMDFVINGNNYAQDVQQTLLLKLEK